MSSAPQKLKDDAVAIWQAGVDAVRSERLIAEQVSVQNDKLHIGPIAFELNRMGRLAVVGAGKAGAGMAAAVEIALGEKVLKEKKVQGWVNVPEDCVRDLSHIHLHAARPAGVNEPTQAGVEGTEKILQLAASLGPNDVCLCLISGGGSALLPAPVDGITLADKQAVTRHLSAAGANIEQLNAVRKQLSRIKGGGLARACGAGTLISLIISDVTGDPLDVIASGPTVQDTSTPQQALDLLHQFQASSAGISPAVFQYLQQQAAQHSAPKSFPTNKVHNWVIGNNARAVQAAAEEARRRGYVVRSRGAETAEGLADEVGRSLVRELLQHEAEFNALITGGEPVVQLAPAAKRGKGGRNQQLVLAALVELLKHPLTEELALLSGGTDGEDGPTNAAGAVLDAKLLQQTVDGKLDPQRFLETNDAYHFFQPLDGLLLTGPTHTNVMDVRVALVGAKIE